MANLSFDKLTKVITVDLPDIEITIQELIDKIRDWEEELEQLSIFKVADASGKEELGGGIKVGITLTLIDWKITFASRPGPDWVLCRISGGNLVRYDSGTQTYGDPIEPSAYVTISLTSSSSATLQDIDAIRYSSYQNSVWIDVINSSLTGTEYPIGTREFPVNNIQDAVLIASGQGFDTLQCLSDTTLDTGDNIENLTIHGRNTVQTNLIINSGALTSDCEIQNACVSGILDGGTLIKSCNIGHLEYVNGEIHLSMLEGEIILGGQSEARIVNCHSAVRGQDTPTINLGGSGQGLQLRNYNGGIQLKNKTGTEAVSIDLNSGQIKIDNTVVNGTVVCRGVGKLIDNSNGANVVNELLSVPYIVEGIWEEDMSLHMTSGTAGEFLNLIYDIEGGRWKIDTTANQMVFYAADNITEIARFDLFDSGGSPASDNVYERRRKS
jgi:hypothetical protein